jgi:GMP synthase-like glutamine amidotransferase
LKLGILKAGRPPSACIPRFGTYPDMFVGLLGRETYDYSMFAVDEGELPASPGACDAYLLTGAAAGVYDPLPWIGELKGFLNAAKGRAALVGICFGHQARAQAFGGRVIKSPKGWGIGEHDYRIVHREPWMDDVAQVRMPASHQDQVVELPPGAQVIGGSAFTPFGMLAYEDQPAISLQLHPEFDPDYAKALIGVRRGTRFPEAQADQALESFAAGDDRAKVGAWIRRFLDGLR